MKLFVPPVVVPAILLIGILAYGLHHAPASAPAPGPLALKSAPLSK